MGYRQIAVIVIWAVVLAVAPSPARADNKAESASHVTAADTHYQLGRFAEALAEYSKAYELYAAPPLLFNIAQSHRQLKNWERAVFFFEGYLRARPKAKNRPLVEELLADSQRLLEKERAAAAVKQAEAAEQAAREATQREALRLEAERQRLAEERTLKVEAERKRLDDERQAAVRRVAEDERLRAEQRDREARRARDRDKVYRQWWFWTAIGGAVVAAGGTAYYFSGETTVVQPMGSLGGVDRR